MLLDDLLDTEVVDIRDVVRVTGVSTRTVSRWRSGVRPRSSADDRLRELTAIVHGLRAVLRDVPARLWLRSPNPALDWRKPLELIADGEHERVAACILAVGEGVTA